MRVLVLLSLCSLIACSKSPDPTPAAQAAADSGTAVTPGSGICNAIITRYNELKAAAPMTCTVNEDCACYRTVQSSRTLDVADQKTAVQLQALGITFARAHCPAVDTRSSSQPPCEPRCEAGRCRL